MFDYFESVKYRSVIENLNIKLLDPAVVQLIEKSNFLDLGANEIGDIYNYKKPLKDYSIIIVPINIGNIHWSLVVIQRDIKKFVEYNSKKSIKSPTI